MSSSLFQFNSPSRRRTSMMGQLPSYIQPDRQLVNRGPYHRSMAIGSAFSAFNKTLLGTGLIGGVFLGGLKGLGKIGGAGKKLFKTTIPPGVTRPRPAARPAAPAPTAPSPAPGSATNP